MDVESPFMMMLRNLGSENLGNCSFIFKFAVQENNMKQNNEPMKRTATLCMLLIVCAALLPAQEKRARDKNVNQYTFLLTGASFASPKNGWFEVGCDLTGATPLNRAIGGEAIADAANRMEKETLYSKEELENIDALVIMQVHDRDVFDEPPFYR